MGDNPPSKRLRAAASTACHLCRVAKKRCEGGTPCLSCSRRGLTCTRRSESDSPDSHKDLALEDHAGSAASEQKYMLDVHSTLFESTTRLLDRYFHIISPVWPLVHASDLECRPFTSPLLVRSMCLLSAMSFPNIDTALIRDLTESIYQCLSVDDLLSSPSLPTLQALLLLLACPNFTQRSIMIASVIRMASILSLNLPQSKRPIIYWTCVAWARLEDAVKSKDTDLAINKHKPHLPIAFEPDQDSFFGRIYHLLAEAGTHQNSTSGYNAWSNNASRIPETLADPSSSSPPPLRAETKANFDYFLQLLALYLFAGPQKWKEEVQLEKISNHSPWFRFYPFHYMSEELE